VVKNDLCNKAGELDRETFVKMIRLQLKSHMLSTLVSQMAVADPMQCCMLSVLKCMLSQMQLGAESPAAVPAPATEPARTRVSFKECHAQCRAQSPDALSLQSAGAHDAALEEAALCSNFTARGGKTNDCGAVVGGTVSENMISDVIDPIFSNMQVIKNAGGRLSTGDLHQAADANREGERVKEEDRYIHLYIEERERDLERQRKRVELLLNKIETIVENSDRERERERETMGSMIAKFVDRQDQMLEGIMDALHLLPAAQSPAQCKWCAERASVIAERRVGGGDSGERAWGDRGGVYSSDAARLEARPKSWQHAAHVTDADALGPQEEARRTKGGNYIDARDRRGKSGNEIAQARTRPGPMLVESQKVTSADLGTTHMQGDHGTGSHRRVLGAPKLSVSADVVVSYSPATPAVGKAPTDQKHAVTSWGSDELEGREVSTHQESRQERLSRLSRRALSEAGTRLTRRLIDARFLRADASPLRTFPALALVC